MVLQAGKHRQEMIEAEKQEKKRRQQEFDSIADAQRRASLIFGYSQEKEKVSQETEAQRKIRIRKRRKGMIDEDQLTPVQLAERMVDGMTCDGDPSSSLSTWLIA